MKIFAETFSTMRYTPNVQIVMSRYCFDGIISVKFCKEACVMRINLDFPVQQPRDANFQKNAAGRAGGEAEVGDVLAIDPRGVDVHGEDRGVRESQDAMTLFRITEDALDKIEDALVRMGELAERAGSAGGAELERMRLNADDLAEVVRFTSGSTTMGGVPVFGGSAPTSAMWSATIRSVNALSPDSGNERIADAAATGLDALGLGSLDIGAPEAPAKIEAAAVLAASAKDTMRTQAARMGDVAREMAARALNRFSAGTRITDTNTAAGLMQFVREGITTTPDASVSAQARQDSFEVVKVDA
jgi:hypothetical protein